MACQAHQRDFVPYFGGKAATGSKAVANRPGFLLRIFDAIFESRQRQAEQEIARFLGRSGGRITDDMERQMTQRLLTGNWNARP